MPFDEFHKHKTALPQYKRLCDRTIRVTMGGQLRAPRTSKHGYHYRLFADFMEMLLEIEEAMELLRDLHDFRRKTPSNPSKTPDLHLNRFKTGQLHQPNSSI
jgi:hypothetical protein